MGSFVNYFLQTIILYLCVIAITVNKICFGDSNFDNLNENGFTIYVNPGAMECFFQSAKINDAMEIEFQVVDSSYGQANIGRREMTINFQLISPSGKLVLSDLLKEEGMHRHEVLENGDYKICLDNRNSQFSRKTVFLEIYLDTSIDGLGSRWGDLDLPPDLAYNDSVEIIKSAINKVHDDLKQIEHYQAQKKANEARDRNLQEHNFNVVNFFSILSILVMLVVGAVQVIMVRSLFQEKSRLYKIFKALS